MPIDLLPSKRVNRFSRGDFNLPLDHVVLLVCVKASRISKEQYLAWLSILEGNRKSILWFTSIEGEAQQNLIDLCRTTEVSCDRLHFQSKANGSPKSYLNREDHLSRLSLADFVLDSWVYNGHSTTVDAINAGREVLCLEGHDWSSSVSASILSVLGCKDLIFSTKESYIIGIGAKIDELCKAGKIGVHSIDLSQNDYSFENWFQDYESKIKEVILLEKEKDS
ncbi:hypothetical protein MJH12_14030 [bacterium]|nr:hypothetical protein [bacterium]